ncbi:MAG: hypothetical protein VYC11_06270, partial [Candidatus Thermoplasmatota archaeon]|nr:hypothetical protein [Candidatus Thermoplasmatota archaeon]
YVPFFWFHQVSTPRKERNIGVAFWWDAWSQRFDLQWPLGLTLGQVGKSRAKLFLNFMMFSIGIIPPLHGTKNGRGMVLIRREVGVRVTNHSPMSKVIFRVLEDTM